VGTKYLNQIYTVSREVRDQATNEIQVAADYSELGDLILASILIGLLLPFAAIWIARVSRLKWA